MNQAFVKMLEKSGMSMYALSKSSGVPYSTINELKNGKHNINQCSAETVLRLATALDQEAAQLLNPFRFLDGLTGKYRGISFHWEYDGETVICFESEGEQICLRTGKTLNIPKRRKYYDTIAGWMIQEYLDQQEWEKQADLMYQKAADHE